VVFDKTFLESQGISKIVIFEGDVKSLDAGCWIKKGGIRTCFAVDKVAKLSADERKPMEVSVKQEIKQIQMGRSHVVILCADIK